MLNITPSAMPQFKNPSHITRFDGAIWDQHSIGEGSLTVTSSGRDLLSNRPEIKLAIEQYMIAVTEPQASTPGIRRFLAEGNHARVYSVGDTGLVMKERKSIVADPLWPAIQRMDFLADVIQKHCPRWIDIPAHYGVYQPDDTSGKEFMLMEKIDSGVTVGDVMGAHDMPREPHIGEAVMRIFRGVTPQTQIAVKSQFDEMKSQLKSGLITEGAAPDAFLTDIDHNMYNAIVEPLSTPVAGSHYKLTIIDQ